jgi:hypothetical protein
LDVGRSVLGVCFLLQKNARIENRPGHLRFLPRSAV